MIRIATFAAAALMAAACTPQTTTAAGSGAPMQSADASACATRGGTMQQIGRMQSWQCVVRYADAGKPCTEAAQCQGGCVLEGNAGVQPGAAVTGVCKADSNRFGCHTPVNGGKAGAALCID